jgi:hypothetical protein
MSVLRVENWKEVLQYSKLRTCNHYYSIFFLQFVEEMQLVVGVMEQEIDTGVRFLDEPHLN